MKALNLKSFILLILCSSISLSVGAQEKKSYQPSRELLKSSEWFKDAKYGLFIHWGLYSILGDGEWVMNDKNITVKNYSRLKNFFYPMHFDAQTWVQTAKSAGMKYITLVTRHHDGFSMWPTKYSDFHIGNTPFKRDIVKELSEECHKQGIKLFLYYSLLDWRRDDYQYWTGRTGQGTGRKTKGNWADYIQFMKNQLTELLSNYGEIGGIWFDGYWDQMDVESADRKEDEVKADWHMRELYDLIHQLQPSCLVGNNHHISPLEGEDFQMFEQSVPSETGSKLNYQSISSLPLETCATMNNSWGFNMTDTSYKSKKELINFLVKSAGSGGNLLLNIGPMPDGKIQDEFTDALNEVKKWLDIYGESVYGTDAGYLKPNEWGCVTRKANKNYIHILKNLKNSQLELERFPQKIKKAYLLNNKKPILFKKNKGTLILEIPQKVTENEPDVVVVLES